MKELVLSLLEKSEKALSSIEIGNMLNLDTVEELTKLLEVLTILEEESKIYKTRKDKYILFKNSHLKTGRLSVNKKGFGFVSVNGELSDYYIDSKNMNGALNNDIVIIEAIKGSGKKTEAKVIKVLKKENNLVIGEYNNIDGVPYFKPDDEKLKLEIIIDKDDIPNLIPGHKIQVSLIKELSKNKYLGKVNKIIGHKNDPGVDILSIVYSYDINDSFSDEVISEVNNIPNKVEDNELINRKDLRDEIIFTIDGDDTKDIDDAVSIKKKGDNYILGVHIADVSYYVRENTEIYKEAYSRGTSVYLVDRVIPMLPHKLSNGICSLNPNEDRLSISCVMEISKTGKVLSYDIFPSVIKSKIQMTYNNVNKVLNGEVVKGYEEYVESLKQMEELSKILRNDKLSRGYLDFDTDEAKILVDEVGKPYKITVRERGTAEKIIEDFMIVANETVASHLYYLNYPSVYRVHEIPDDEKIKDFINLISNMGIDVKGKRNFNNPMSLKKILDQLRDREEFEILSSMLLRCMKKAEYKDQNLGHYGLASKCYTHFTSPIRRFPDLIIHTLLRKYIFNEPSTKELNDLINDWSNKLPEITAHSSEKERNSIDCERDVESMKMAEYMESHIGEEFDGIINTIMNFGMFIELPNLIEGLVKVDSMVDDYYEYNDVLNILVGKRHKKMYKIGQKVKVRCVAASKENSTIDFELVEKR